MLFKLFLISLFSFTLSAMEINDNTPLLKILVKRYDKDLEAQRDPIEIPRPCANRVSQTYLTRLDINTAYLITQYVEGNNSGLPLVIEKVSPNENEAKALYEKILESHAEFADVRKIIENIENKKTKVKLLAAAQPHEDMIAQARKNLRENKIEIIQPFFEREMGTPESLRRSIASSVNRPEFKRIRQNIALYGQIVNDMKSDLENIEKSNEFKQAYLSPSAFPTIFIFVVSGITSLMLLLYGSLHMNGFDYNTCWGDKANECLANYKAYNCSDKDSFTCCGHFGYNFCTPIATQYNNSHTPLDAWTPFIVGTSLLITLNGALQLVARKCMRPKIIAPEFKDLVKNYSTQIACIKALPRSV